MHDINEYLKDGSAATIGLWLAQKTLSTSRLLGRLTATADQLGKRLETLEANVFGVTIHEEEKKSEHKHSAAARGYHRTA
jgi:hypothetical protein